MEASWKKVTNMNSEQEKVGAVISASSEGKQFSRTTIILYRGTTVGRAKRGARSVSKVPGSEGPNLHIIGCLSPRKLV